MRFLLDANAYITAKNFYYDMQVCPGFWDFLDQQFGANEVGSIKMIATELKAGNDELADWVKARPEHFLNNDDAETQAVFGDIVEAVMAADYQAANRDNFLAKGDPWLIAKAKTSGATVVTLETRVVPTTRRVKIPNICHQFGVPCITTFQLLKELKAKFILAPAT